MRNLLKEANGLCIGFFIGILFTILEIQNEGFLHFEAIDATIHSGKPASLDGDP